MIRFRCSKCSKKLKAEEEIIGRKVRCARCQSVEVVPPTDNLAKPNSSNVVVADSESEEASTGDLTESINEPGSDQLKVVKPKRKPPRKKFLTDGPVPELFGHSAIRPDSRALDEPENGPAFKAAKKKKRFIKWDKWLVPILATGTALAIAAVIAYLVIAARYAEPSFAADFEALEEVKYYQKSIVELEKSRVVMSIMTKAFQSQNIQGSEYTGKFTELENSVTKYKSNAKELMTEAATLYAKGKDVHAKSLLVTTAREMRTLKGNIDREVADFNDKLNRM